MTLFRKDGLEVNSGKAAPSSSRPSPRKSFSSKLTISPSVTVERLKAAKSARTCCDDLLVGLSTIVLASEYTCAMLTVWSSWIRWKVTLMLDFGYLRWLTY